MELVIPISQLNMDFEFNSARNSPYPSPPSTPRRFGGGDYFFSAPPSPTHTSEFYRDLIDDEFSSINKFEDDFAFDISHEESNRASLSAEELFDGGIIKPLKPPPPPPPLRSPDFSLSGGTKSPKSSSSPIVSQLSKKISTLSTNSDPSQSPQHKSGNHNRGIRGRTTTTTTISSSNSGRRAARSLSPLRVSQYPWEEEEGQQQQQQKSSKHQQPQQQLALASKQDSFGSSSSSSSNKGSKKWRLKDFFLFRSSSDGRAYEKDPLRKYSISSFKKHEDVVKNTNSFNSSMESSSGIVKRSSRKKGQVSAHELHYTVNKAVSQEMKKKTFLPYKQGILGRLSFNPAVSALANGFGSFART